MANLLIQLLNIVNEMIEVASTSNDSPAHSMHSNSEDMMSPSFRNNDPRKNIFVMDEAVLLLDIDT